MKQSLQLLLVAALAATLMIGLGACKKEEETLGDKVDEAIDETGDALEEAAEDLGDKLDEGVDELEEAKDDAADALEDATDDLETDDHGGG